MFCLVDMHALTVFREPGQLRRDTLAQAACLIASGIDPEKHVLYNQSAVSAHARLGWIFNCVVRLGWLNRMTQFKEKAGKDREQHSAGLFVYPALMQPIFMLSTPHVCPWERTRNSISKLPMISAPNSTTITGWISSR